MPDWLKFDPFLLDRDVQHPIHVGNYNRTVVETVDPESEFPHLRIQGAWVVLVVSFGEADDGPDPVPPVIPGFSRTRGIQGGASSFFVRAGTNNDPPDHFHIHH